ncbi:HlyD family efflux transporter periplasmic adaptor subunit [Leptolyngbya sp. FACHB-16]|nr:HlyD family efflux transporter periplasmic adaptor subunit [Leptolyngbya sp. FACHB-8]MBD2158095.1 HlyD family efflux transporter periplasmic adaptor subunit [Leptolyngbya sp. FACHB-16]
MTQSFDSSDSSPPTNTLPLETRSPGHSESSVPEHAPPPQKPRRGIPKPVRILGAIALLAGLGFGIYRLFFYEPEPDGLFLSGRIEGYETDISAKTGGQVEAVLVREGERVETGKLLIELDEAELQAQLEGAIARVEAAQNRLERAQQQIPVLQAQAQAARLQQAQAGQQSQGQVTEAQNQVAVAQAELAAAQERLQLAQVEQRRYSQLFAEGAASAQRLDEENQQLGVAQAEVRAAQQRVQAATAQLTQAQAGEQNSPIRAAEVLQIERQIAQAETEVAIAQRDIRSAQAEQARIQANLDDLTIRSPASGTIITRLAEPGEVVAAGAPLLTLVDTDGLYLRGFIPEGEIGRVQIGQQAHVYLDSFPDRPLDATVSRIDPEASFTPENTYFKDDRVTQVFGVELTIENPQGLAKQGMPADGRILIPENLAE